MKYPSLKDDMPMAPRKIRFFWLAVLQNVRVISDLKVVVGDWLRCSTG